MSKENIMEENKFNEVEIIRLTFGRARIVQYSDRISICNSWWYDTLEAAVAALNNWDRSKESEPDGWMRNPHDGRRRPNGDKSKEYIWF